jgi:hypothetical protein
LGLRPYGDIDLLLRPEDDRPAFDSVAGWERAHYTFDIQYQDYPKLADRTLDDLFRRSQLVPLQDTEIRVLSHEDHLALTCLHFLRHGGFRPLWLCDIAMYVESLPAGFDWQLCLGSDPVVAGWLESAIALAHVILGARIDGTPAMARVPRLPSWLVPALLKAWRRPFPYQHPETHEPIRAVLRHPSRLAEAVRARWWDPIRASIWAGAPLDSSPRLPLQVQNAVWQLRNYGAEFRPPPRAGGTGARSAP